MENIILSLLMLKNMTVYELQTSIAKSMNTICSSSMGSIQVALKKLLTAGRIEVTEYEEKGVIKKEYHLTSLGKEQFQNWIMSPMNWNKAKNMEEGKFLFLGMIPKEARMQQLGRLIKNLKKELIAFKQVEYTVSLTMETIVETNVRRMKNESVLTDCLLSVSHADCLEQVLTDVCSYQCYMLRYAIERLETDIRFFCSIYEMEETNERGQAE